MALRSIVIAALATSIVAAGIGVGAAADEVKKKEASSSTGDVAAAPPVYKLPKVGKPTGRVGGGRRGASSDLPQIYALVPDHVGYTTSEQPILYWYLSERAQGQLKFELTLIDERSVDPLIDEQFPAPETPGLQSIRLAEHGVKLRPGEEYQWSVSLVPDPTDHSKDIVSSGWIERVPEPAELPAKLAAAGPDRAALIYGEEGLWYDTVAVACDQMAQHPDDERFRQQLASLLTQVGLSDAAARP
jgi:hypothetical protein